MADSLTTSYCTTRRTQHNHYPAGAPTMQPSVGVALKGHSVYLVAGASIDDLAFTIIISNGAFRGVPSLTASNMFRHEVF